MGIKAIKKELASLLSADVELTQTHQLHIYPSRQLPGRFDNEMCVFSIGSSPSSEAVLGSATGRSASPIYQYGIWWICKFTTEDLETVEDKFDDIEDAVYRVLFKENYSNVLWKKMSFPTLSLRPRAPGGTQNSHFGRIIIRIKAHD